jgi:hypothetical protein
LLAHFKEIDMVDQNLRPAPAVSLFQFHSTGKWNSSRRFFHGIGDWKKPKVMAI